MIKVVFMVVLSPMSLLKMKGTVVANLGSKVKDAVVIVLVYFNGSQRQATKDAYSFIHCSYWDRVCVWHDASRPGHT